MNAGRTAHEKHAQSSDAPAAEESRGSAVESAKSFIAGGFGGVAAVLVGACGFLCPYRAR